MTLQREPDFARAARLATKLLAAQDLTAGPVHIKNFSFEKNICFYSARELCDRYPLKWSPRDFGDNCDGVTQYSSKKDTYLVIYSDEGMSNQRINWTIAHELGHIYLDHGAENKRKKAEEIEAHYFASQLLMPEYTVYMMALKHKRVKAIDLITLFDISHEAAVKKIRNMNNRHCYSSTKEDLKIWEMLEPTVDFYYKCKEKRLDYHYEVYKEEKKLDQFLTALEKELDEYDRQRRQLEKEMRYQRLMQDPETRKFIDGVSKMVSLNARGKLNAPRWQSAYKTIEMLQDTTT